MEDDHGESRVPTPSVSLIGMPGAGKSTVGVLLAKTLGMDFVDTDLLIQRRTGVSLQTTLDAEGVDALRGIEESVICDMLLDDAVVATGGSAVHGARAMDRLQTETVVVYLAVPFTRMLERIGDASRRGIAKPAGMSLEQMYAERDALYRRYAEHVVDADRPPETVRASIESAIRRTPAR